MTVWQVLNKYGDDAGNDMHMAVFQTEELADAWITYLIEDCDAGASGPFTKHKRILLNEDYHSSASLQGR